MRISLVLDWRDLWVGAFWDSQRQRLYILPLPCVGICFDFGRARKADRETRRAA